MKVDRGSIGVVPALGKPGDQRLGGRGMEASRGMQDGVVLARQLREPVHVIQTTLQDDRIDAVCL